MKNPGRAAAAVLAFLLIAPGAARAAGGLDELVGKAVKAYGGEKALRKAATFRQEGRLVSTMREGKTGTIRRAYERPDRLRVEVSFPGEDSEVRVLDGRKGWRQGEEVSGPPLSAMVLQASRLGLPLNLLDAGKRLRDRGTAVLEGKTLRRIELPLEGGLALVAEIDPSTGRILRSSGRGESGGPPLDFVTTYGDFRKAGGVLFAFREGNYANGVVTGETVLERIEVVGRLPGATFRP